MRTIGFDQFVEELMFVPCISCHQSGTGRIREVATFEFQGQIMILESVFPWSLCAEATAQWITGYGIRGKRSALRVAKAYGAELEAQWYSDTGNEWNLRWSTKDDGFRRMARWVYDRCTGKVMCKFSMGAVPEEFRIRTEN